MKKVISVVVFTLIMQHSFGQDMPTLIKLHDVSTSLGISNSITVDTLLLKERIDKINNRVAEQQSYLLRAAEFYTKKDYENSIYYIKRVVINFKTIDFNTLKFLLLIGNYANLKDIENTARYFYIVNKSRLIDPENMRAITSAVRDNFSRADFDDALSPYYYYHRRLKMLDAIKFNK
jgi:hypothetical protein